MMRGIKRILALPVGEFFPFALSAEIRFQRAHLGAVWFEHLARWSIMRRSQSLARLIPT